MKLLLILFLGFSGPTLPLKTSHDLKMDSIAMANLPHNLNLAMHPKTDILSFRPNQYLKFTFKSGYNPTIYNTLAHTGSLGMDTQHEMPLGGSDYLNLIMYDVRVKVYITRRFGLVNRILFTGLYTKKYVYQIGINYKF